MGLSLDDLINFLLEEIGLSGQAGEFGEAFAVARVVSSPQTLLYLITPLPTTKASLLYSMLDPNCNHHIVFFG